MKRRAALGLLLTAALTSLVTFCSFRDLDYIRDSTCAPHCGADAASDTGSDAGSDAGSETEAATDVANPGCTAPDYRGLVMCANPVAYWRLGEATGSATAKDETGNHSAAYGEGDASLMYGQPGAIASDPDNKSILFDFSNARVDAGPVFDLSENHAVTFELWERMDQTHFGFPRIFERTLYDGLGHISDGFTLIEDQGLLRFQRYVGGQNSDVGVFGGKAAEPGVNDDVFHYVVCTYDGEKLRLYIDGLPMPENDGGVASDPRALKASLSGANFLIGGGAGAETDWRGYVDELAVYDRALTANEISRHYNAAKGL